MVELAVVKPAVFAVLELLKDFVADVLHHCDVGVAHHLRAVIRHKTRGKRAGVHHCGDLGINQLLCQWTRDIRRIDHHDVAFAHALERTLQAGTVPHGPRNARKIFFVPREQTHGT